MTEDGWRENVLTRLSSLEVGQRALSDRLVKVETKNAVDEVHRDNVEKRLSSIEGTLNKLVWLIVSSLLLAILGYALQGGFSLG